MSGASAELPDLVRKLPDGVREALEALVEMLVSERRAPSAVREPSAAWRAHIADSLVGVEFRELATAATIADVGAGAGLPGLVLAAALPEARIDLIESVGRKCEFMRRVVDRMGLRNARVVCERSESWATADGREAYDAVTARAVGRLATIAELASPLLREGGAVVAWKGRRDADEEAELARAAARLAIEPVEVRWVGPYAGSRHRHLHLMRKAGPSPADLPRRPGAAKMRPFGK